MAYSGSKKVRTASANRLHSRDGDTWLAACRSHGVLPGLWFGCNAIDPLFGVNGCDRWTGSVDPAGGAACCFEGPFLDDFLGNLDLLDDRDAAWFGRAQGLFWPLLARGSLDTLGAIPGSGLSYGFYLHDAGGLLAAVNPGHLHAELELPGHTAVRILFRNAGYAPEFSRTRIRLGPEQLVLLGTATLAPHTPLHIRASSRETTPVRLSVEAYHVA